MTSRRQQIFQAIVEDYVNFREPVGSKALIERHGLGVSSATVRNDMAALEEEGLIMAPHASSGRIPTEAGYRVFVNEIKAPRPLSEAQKRGIHRILDSSESLEEIYEHTVKVLSQLTHQAAVLQYPAEPVQTVRHIELIGLGQKQVNVMLISASGRVLQRIVSVEAYEQEDLERLRNQLLEAYRGEELSSLAQQASCPQDSLYRAVNQALIHFASHDQPAKLLIAGTSFLARSTHDFSRSVAPILDALEEQVTMLHLLSNMVEDSRGFSVQIGTENNEALAETAIVASSYDAVGAARVGVIGPTRMDYLQTTSAVRGVAGYLAKILGN